MLILNPILNVNFVKLLGLKTIAVEVPPGRHLYQINIYSKKSFVAHFLSDCQMLVGNIELISHYLKYESDMLTSNCFKFASNFGKLIQKFGTPEYGQGLRDYYSSYMMGLKLDPRSSLIVHKWQQSIFLDVVSKLMKNLHMFIC